MEVLRHSDTLFFDGLKRFFDYPCLIETDGRALTYRDVERLSDEIFHDLPANKQLAFILGYNNISTITSYLGALRQRYAVHILDPEKHEANSRLIEVYNPNVVVDCAGQVPVVNIRHDDDLSIHEDICILLSTSGSTGAAKFCKLSYENIQSNTDAISQYLDVSSSDRSITLLKSFYSYGMSVINSHLNVGGSLVLTEGSIQDPEFFGLVRSRNITNIPGVPHTYEMLEKLDPDFSELRSLRFLTQAGGALSPRLVRHFSSLGSRHGWKFYVMYGQTEASPRMAYLPPELSERFPTAIGVAVPGGAFELIDEDGSPIKGDNREGELVYRGPNVMRGYATTWQDLGHVEQLNGLHTGDMARLDESGLLFITGRKSRFVKPFGLRVGLDEIETSIKNQNGLDCAVIGFDERVVVFIAGDGHKAPDLALHDKYKLPSEVFRYLTIDEIPRMASGKIDYSSLKRRYQAINAEENRPTPKKVLAYFLREIARPFKRSAPGDASVIGLFSEIFSGSTITMDDSFLSLEGDSMRYVQMSLMLEDQLQKLPKNWHSLSIRELEAFKSTLGA